jgi:hypothetical protein
VRARAVAGLVCAMAAVALAACGDDAKTTGSGEGAEPSGTSSVTTTAAPTSTAPTTTPTATTGVPVGGVTTGETTSTSSGESGESGEGGAGDEEPARVPVALTHAGGSLSPTTVTVPAFLALEIRISGPATTATLPGGGRLTVPGAKTIAGLKPGKYTISTADGGKTTLDVVSGGDPGP